MDPQLSSLFEQQEQRLTLMRELNAVLELAQGAFVASDLNKMESYTTRQRIICEALCAMGNPEERKTALAKMQWDEKQDDAPEATLPLTKERWEMLSQELQAVAEQIRHLNRVHAALLRRGRQTVEIFLRVMANSYAPSMGRQAANEILGK